MVGRGFGWDEKNVCPGGIVFVYPAAEQKQGSFLWIKI